MQESESERAKRHGRLEHEQQERDRHEGLAHEAGVKSGRAAAEVERRFRWEEDARRPPDDDVSGLPEFVDIVLPKDGQAVSGRQVVRYNSCCDSGIVSFGLVANGVRIRTRNCGADSFVHSRGNRFVVDFGPYPDGPVELSMLMTGANEKTYVSSTVVVMVKA